MRSPLIIPILITTGCGPEHTHNDTAFPPAVTETADTSEQQSWGSQEAYHCLEQTRDSIANTAIKIFVGGNSYLGCDEKQCKLVVEHPGSEKDEAYLNLDFTVSANEQTRFANSYAVEPLSSEATDLQDEEDIIIPDGDDSTLMMITFPAIPDDVSSYSVSGVNHLDDGNCPDASAVYDCANGISYQGNIGDCNPIGNFIHVDANN